MTFSKKLKCLKTAHDETLEKSTDLKMKMACYHWSAMEPMYIATPSFEEVK